jgi:PPOX class probable F420-dependent enzyme
MKQEEARDRFAAARVARLATAGEDGAPHVVPLCFALDGETLWWAVDAKPKRTRALRRLRNIEANPSVSVLVDAYDEDWSRLWWVRADGRAGIVGDRSARERGLAALAAKYPQYVTAPPAGPVVAVEVDAWRSWSAAGG